MTETPQAARASRDGDPCPPWCDRDHAAASATHIRQTGSIDVGDGGLDSIWASVILAVRHAARPVVAVISHRYGQHGAPHVEVAADFRAGELAGLVEMLAGATPDQHRELAAAIRAAAALATEGSDG